MPKLASATVPAAGVPHHHEARLARARWLGYLVTDRPHDPAVGAYLGECLENLWPAIVLYRRGRHGATIVYQIPIGRRVLKADAVEQLRHHAALLHPSRCRRRPIITRVGGEITGLPPERAEELAFRIADAAQDADQTESGRPTTSTWNT